MSTARTALAAHGRLHDGLAHPSGLMTGYLKGFALDAHSKVGDQGVDMMFYPFRPNRSRDEAAQWAATVARSLFQARTYQVTEPIMDAVQAAYETRAGTMMHLEEWELPAPHGFVYLDKPLDMTDRSLLHITERAFSWELTTANVRYGRDEARGEPALRVCSWTHIDDPNAIIEAAPREASLLRLLGDLTLSHSMVLMFGKRWPEFVGGRTPDGADSGIGWLHCLWLFMDMEITATARQPLDRAARRRARNLAQQDVSVVLLRRVHAQRPDGDAEHRPVDWSCQWIVQGHWRHLDAYLQPRHHAIPDSRGPDPVRCLTCGSRITWVKPYLKGPDGMPLRAAEHVFRVAR